MSKENKDLNDLFIYNQSKRYIEENGTDGRDIQVSVEVIRAIYKEANEHLEYHGKENK
jgi:hypothetical protein